MQILVTIAPLCSLAISTPSLRSCSVCSGDIFGSSFISDDCVVTSHKPGLTPTCACAANEQIRPDHSKPAAITFDLTIAHSGRKSVKNANPIPRHRPRQEANVHIADDRCCVFGKGG